MDDEKKRRLRQLLKDADWAGSNARLALRAVHQSVDPIDDGAARCELGRGTGRRRLPRRGEQRIAAAVVCGERARFDQHGSDCGRRRAGGLDLRQAVPGRALSCSCP
jgi:hypothetical protein